MTYKESFLISRYFKRVKNSRIDVETGIGDDCAILSIPEKKNLAISTDTLVCDRHFHKDINPSDISYKSLAVNLSDLSAMGADPAWVTLALTLPKINESWLEEFSNSLFEQLNYYNIQLIGGDITAGPLSITPTVYGFLPKGKALKRSGAKPGDWIYVTGNLGDSAAGLAILQNQFRIKNINDTDYLIKRHLNPTPRILQGQFLLYNQTASSAIDLSDGLIKDLKHILESSNVGASINLDLIPISSAVRKNIEPNLALKLALSGGEDYELCFTVPELQRISLDVRLNYFDVPFTCIGKILSKNEGLQFLQNGKSLQLDFIGYEHFS